MPYFVHIYSLQITATQNIDIVQIVGTSVQIFAAFLKEGWKSWPICWQSWQITSSSWWQFAFSSLWSTMFPFILWFGLWCAAVPTLLSLKKSLSLSASSLSGLPGYYKCQLEIQSCLVSNNQTLLAAINLGLSSFSHHFLAVFILSIPPSLSLPLHQLCEKAIEICVVKGSL